jgi:hypothetical protein
MPDPGEPGCREETAVGGGSGQDGLLGLEVIEQLRRDVEDERARFRRDLAALAGRVQELEGEVRALKARVAPAGRVLEPGEDHWPGD